MARLLNVYQLWLDDLYPRAKFADGLAIIEKLGHTKRMQTMRREWINEGKPPESLHSLGEGAERPTGEQVVSKNGPDHSQEVKLSDRPRTPIAVVEEDDDLYAATPKIARGDGTTKRNFGTKYLVPVDDDADAEDDLNALLWEDSTKTVPLLGQTPGSPRKEENFFDEEEAILALNDMW